MGTEAPPGNGCATTLASYILYTDATCDLVDVTAFSDAQYHCLITDGTNFEIVEATGLSGSTLSINRAAENWNGASTAYGFAAGSTITVVTSLQSVLNLIAQGGGGLPAWFQSGSGSPVGVVTPNRVGALYADTAVASTGNWVAIGATSAGWMFIKL